MLVAVDAVVFGYVEKDLKILLIQRKYEPFQNSWALPGGFVSETETLEEAVKRELKEETGIENIYLEQLYSFGNVNRDPRQRVLSISYYGLVKPELFNIVATTDAQDVKWFSLNDLPSLAFDHSEIIKLAHTRLKGKLTYQPIGFELLPEKFSMTQLQKLYETIAGYKFERSNFRRKFLSLDILNETPKQEGIPYNTQLFRFNEDKYKAKEKSGFYFML